MTIKNKSLKEMFKDSEMSTELQTEINDIFEAAVADATKEKEEEIKAKVEADKEKEVEEKVESKVKELEEANEKYKEEVLNATVEKYAEEAVNEWMEENKVAVENNLVVEMAQEFLQAGTKLFETTGFKIDKKDIDINKDLNERIKNIEADQEKLLESNIELKKANAQLIKESKTKEVLGKLELAESQIEKVSGAIEKLSYKNDEQFEIAVKSIVESYFPKVGEEEENKDKKEPENINEGVDFNDELFEKFYNQL